MEKKLCRSEQNKKLAGVCGGLAEYFGLSVSGIRIVWVIFSFFGAGIFLYLILALILPKQTESKDNNTTPNTENKQETSVSSNLSQEQKITNFSAERENNGIDKINKTKKKGWLCVSITAILFIIGLILVIINEQQELAVITVFLFIVGFGALVSLIVGVAFFVQASDMTMRTCLNCGEKIFYDDLAYEEVSSRTTDNANYVTIQFTVRCLKCGTVRTFKKEYTTARIDNQGNLQRIDVEAQIRKIYK